MDDLTRLRNAAKSLVNALILDPKFLPTEDVGKAWRGLRYVLEALDNKEKKEEEATKYNRLTGMKCVLVKDEKLEKPIVYTIVGNSPSVPGLLFLRADIADPNLGHNWSADRKDVLVLGEDADIKTVAVRRETQ